MLERLEGRRAPEAVRSHADFLALRRIPTLDGFRALSVLLVVTAHVSHGGFWSALHGHGGVSVFFVLSGFLITTLALREVDRTGTFSLRAFYVRRAFRIQPLYHLVLAVYCVVLLVGVGGDRARSFAAELPWFLLGVPEHAVYFTHPGAHPPFTFAWSLGIEEKFYLVWPLVGFVLLRAAAARHRGVVLGAVVGACGLASAVDAPLLRAVAPYGLLATGCLAALLLHHERSYRHLARLGRLRLLLPATAVLLVVQFGTDLANPGGPLYVAVGLPIAAVVVGAVVRRGAGVGWLESRPLVFLGTISFGVYLTNNLTLEVAERVVPGSGGFAGSLVSTTLGVLGAVVLSAALHRWYEAPLHAVGQRTARRWA